MSLLEKIRRHGLRGSFEKALLVLRRKSGYDLWRVRHAPVYTNPTPSELAAIEADLIALGVTLNDYSPPPLASRLFKRKAGFRLIIMADGTATSGMRSCWNIGLPHSGWTL